MYQTKTVLQYLMCIYL